MIYIAQVIAYTGLLWAIYALLLRDRPIHGFNRAYLLLSTILPFAIPFITLPQQTYSRVANITDLGVQLPEIVVGQVLKPQTEAATDWLLVAYVAVALALLVVMAIRWLKLYRVIKRSKAIPQQGYTLLMHTKYGPGSWGKYIFLPEGMVDDTIIKHELAHIQLKHTADVLCISLLQCLCWPNLFLHLLKKELKQLHEYQADVIACNDKTAYQQLLVASLFNTCTLPFTHSFIIHPIKRRIKMLNKKMNSNKNRVAAIAALAITGAVAFNMVALQSCKRKQWAADVKTADNRTTNANNKITYTDENGKRRYAAEMPEFDRNIMEYIGKNIVYPEYAKKNKIEGKVMVRVLIDTLGNVLEKEITQSPDASLSQAVMDMLDKMPKWKTNMQNGKPGTEYFLPVLFKLDNKKTAYLYTPDDKTKKAVGEAEYEAALKTIETYHGQQMKMADEEMKQAKEEMKRADEEMKKANEEMKQMKKELETRSKELKQQHRDLEKA